MKGDRLERLISKLNDAVQQSPNREALLSILARRTTRELRGVCDLNYLDTEASPAKMLKSIADEVHPVNS